MVGKKTVVEKLVQETKENYDSLSRTLLEFRKEAKAGRKESHDSLSQALLEFREEAKAGRKENYDSLSRTLLEFRKEAKAGREDLQNQIDEKFNRILDGQDIVVTELKLIRQEQVMMQSAFSRHGNKLENHEERIAYLEVR